MTEYAHNHPPRCCCPDLQRESYSLTCPLCPEHGELAQLGNNNSADAEMWAAEERANGGQITPTEEIQRATLDATIAGNGYLLNGKRIPPEDITVVSAEYPCCHQLAGRPHTDYCPSRHGQQQTPAEVQRIAQANLAANPLGMTRQPHTHHHGADVHPTHQCHPDRCGMWATTTSTPPTQTSQPITQARDSHVGPRDRPGTHHADDCPMRVGLTTTGCLCGREGERGSTPLATPTPGHCICGNDYDDTPAPGCCPVPERHDHPR